MNKKVTMWTVIGVLVLVIATGIGIMCSGEKSEIKTITTEQVTDSTSVDTVTNDTAVVNSIQ